MSVAPRASGTGLRKVSITLPEQDARRAVLWAWSLVAGDATPTRVGDCLGSELFLSTTLGPHTPPSENWQGIHNKKRRRGLEEA